MSEGDIIERLRRLTPEQREEIRAQAQEAIDALTGRINAANTVLMRLALADNPPIGTDYREQPHG